MQPLWEAQCLYMVTTDHFSHLVLGMCGHPNCPWSLGVNVVCEAWRTAHMSYVAALMHQQALTGLVVPWTCCLGESARGLPGEVGAGARVSASFLPSWEFATHTSPVVLRDLVEIVLLVSSLNTHQWLHGMLVSQVAGLPATSELCSPSLPSILICDTAFQ